MPAPIPTETVRTQSERKASPTARVPWPRSQSETTPKTTRTGVALNGRIPANPAARSAAATRSSRSRNRCACGRSRKPPGVTPMPEDPMDRGEYHTVGHRTNATGVDERGLRHGARSARLTLRVGAFVEQRGLGEVFAQDTGFKIERDPETVRAPDVAFVPRERLAQIPEAGYAELAPPPARTFCCLSINLQDRERWQEVSDILETGWHLVDDHWP